MERYEIVGRHSKKRYRLGDKLFVQIMTVDLEFNRVNLKPVDNNSKPKRTKSRKRAKRK
jgi:transcriptional accessory protein Tex/SPT6